MKMIMNSERPNPRGFGMIDFLIGISLFFITMYAVATLLGNLGKATRNVRQQAELVYVHNDIYSNLTNQKACRNSFSMFTAADIGNSYSNPTQIKDANDTAVFQTNGIYANGSLKLKEMDLGDFSAEDSVVNPDMGKALLHLTFEKTGESLGSKSLVRDIRLKVTRDPVTKNVTDCVSIGGTKDVWQLNADGSIYYDGGDVGIGTNAPPRISTSVTRFARKMVLVH